MIKVFEKFLDFTSIMTNFREISKLLLNNPPKNTDDISWNDYTIVIQLTFENGERLQELLALVYQEEQGLGSITINFADPKFDNNISVLYDLGSNEKVLECFKSQKSFKRPIIA